MKKEKFSESLNNVNEKYIDEAIKYNAEHNMADSDEFGKDSVGTEQTGDIKSGFKKNLSEDIHSGGKNQTVERPVQSHANKKSGTPDKLTKTIKLWRGIAIAACAVIVCGLGITLIANGLAVSGTSAAYETVDVFEYEPEIQEAIDDDYLYEAANSYESGMVDEDSEIYIEETTAASTTISKKTSGYGDSDAATGAGADDSAADVPANSTKMIYTANVQMETDDFYDTMDGIDKYLSNVEGYYQNMSMDNSGYSYRDAYYILRIPTENLDIFLKSLNDIGTVTSINKNADDVSSYYYDVESRLATAETKLARLQELLSEASDMTDIITIENEISDTEQEIDDLSGTLKGLDSEVSYSTVYLDLAEVYNPEYTEPEPLTFGQRLSNAFNGGLSTFGNFIKGTVLWLASSWIWLLIIAAVVVAVVLIVKKIFKKNKDK